MGANANCDTYKRTASTLLELSLTAACSLTGGEKLDATLGGEISVSAIFIKGSVAGSYECKVEWLRTKMSSAQATATTLTARTINKDLKNYTNRLTSLENKYSQCKSRLDAISTHEQLSSKLEELSQRKTELLEQLNQVATMLGTSNTSEHHVSQQATAAGESRQEIGGTNIASTTTTTTTTTSSSRIHGSSTTLAAQISILNNATLLG